MKKITLNLILSTVAIILFSNCQGKKIEEEKTVQIQEINSSQDKKEYEENTEKIKTENDLIYDSYSFAESLKNDSFFESDNTDHKIELKNVGITSYVIADNEVTLTGIFYNKAKNLAIPRYNNNPPGRSFVPEYFDQLEMKYDVKYKTTYSATLYIVLRNPKDVKKLKMYQPSENVLNYEYKVSGTIDDFRSGFTDLVNLQGTFNGLSPDGIYPNKIYKMTNVEIN